MAALVSSLAGTFFVALPVNAVRAAYRAIDETGKQLWRFVPLMGVSLVIFAACLALVWHADSTIAAAEQFVRCEAKPLVAPFASLVDITSSVSKPLACFVNTPGSFIGLFMSKVVRKALMECTAGDFASITVYWIAAAIDLIVDLSNVFIDWAKEVDYIDTVPSIEPALLDALTLVSASFPHAATCLCEALDFFGDVAGNMIAGHELPCAIHQVFTAAHEYVGATLRVVWRLIESIFSGNYDLDVVRDFPEGVYMRAAEKLSLALAHLVAVLRDNIVANLVCSIYGIASGDSDVTHPESRAAECAAVCSIECRAECAFNWTMSVCIDECRTVCEEGCYDDLRNDAATQCYADAQEYLVVFDVLIPILAAPVRAASAILEALIRAPIWIGDDAWLAYGWPVHTARVWDTLRDPSQHFATPGGTGYVACNATEFCSPSSLPDLTTHNATTPYPECDLEPRFYATEYITCAACATDTATRSLEEGFCLWGTVADDAIGLPERRLFEMVFCGLFGSLVRVAADVAEYVTNAVGHTVAPPVPYGLFLYIGDETNLDRLVQDLRWLADWLGEALIEIVGEELREFGVIIGKSGRIVVEAAHAFAQFVARLLNEVIKLIDGEDRHASEGRLYLRHFLCTDAPSVCLIGKVNVIADLIMQPRYDVITDDIAEALPIQTDRDEGIFEAARKILNVDDILHGMGVATSLPDFGTPFYYAGRIFVDIWVLFIHIVLNFDDAFDYIRCDGTTTTCAPFGWLLEDIEVFIRDGICVVFGDDGLHENQIPVPCTCETSLALSITVRLVLEEAVRLVRMVFDVLSGDVDELVTDALEVLNAIIDEFSLDSIRSYISMREYVIGSVANYAGIKIKDVMLDEALLLEVDRLMVLYGYQPPLSYQIGAAIGCFMGAIPDFFEPIAGPYYSNKDIFIDIGVDLTTIITAVIEAYLRLMETFLMFLDNPSMTFLTDIFSFIRTVVDGIMFGVFGDINHTFGAHAGLVQHLGYLLTAFAGMPGCEEICPITQEDSEDIDWDGSSPVCFGDIFVCLGNILGRMVAGAIKIAFGLLRFLTLVGGADLDEAVLAFREIFEGVYDILMTVIRNVYDFFVAFGAALLSALVGDWLADLWVFTFETLRPVINTLIWFLDIWVSGDSEHVLMRRADAPSVPLTADNLPYFLESESRLVAALTAFVDIDIAAEEAANNTLWRADLVETLFYGGSVCAESLLDMAAYHRALPTASLPVPILSYADRALVHSCIMAAAVGIEIAGTPNAFYDTSNVAHLITEWGDAFPAILEWTLNEHVLDTTSVINTHTTVGAPGDSSRRFVHIESRSDLLNRVGVTSPVLRHTLDNALERRAHRAMGRSAFGDYKDTTRTGTHGNTTTSYLFDTRYERGMTMLQGAVDEIRFGISTHHPSSSSSDGECGYHYVDRTELDDNVVMRSVKRAIAATEGRDGGGEGGGEGEEEEDREERGRREARQYANAVTYTTRYVTQAAATLHNYLWPFASTPPAAATTTTATATGSAASLADAMRARALHGDTGGLLFDALHYKWLTAHETIRARNTAITTHVTAMRHGLNAPHTGRALLHRRRLLTAAHSFSRGVASHPVMWALPKVHAFFNAAASFFAPALRGGHAIDRLILGGIPSHRIAALFAQAEEERVDVEDVVMRVPELRRIVGRIAPAPAPAAAAHLFGAAEEGGEGIPIVTWDDCSIVNDSVPVFLERLNRCIVGNITYYDHPTPLFDLTYYAPNATMRLEDPRTWFLVFSSLDVVTSFGSFITNTNVKPYDGPVGWLYAVNVLAGIPFVSSCPFESMSYGIHGYGFVHTSQIMLIMHAIALLLQVYGVFNAPLLGRNLVSAMGLALNFNIFTIMSWGWSTACLAKMVFPEPALQELLDAAQFLTGNSSLTPSPHIWRYENTTAPTQCPDKYELIDVDGCAEYGLGVGPEMLFETFGYIFARWVPSVYGWLYTTVPWAVGWDAHAATLTHPYAMRDARARSRADFCFWIRVPVIPAAGFPVYLVAMLALSLVGILLFVLIVPLVLGVLRSGVVQAIFSTGNSPEDAHVIALNDEAIFYGENRLAQQFLENDYQAMMDDGVGSKGAPPPVPPRHGRTPGIGARSRAAFDAWAATFDHNTTAPTGLRAWSAEVGASVRRGREAVATHGRRLRDIVLRRGRAPSGDDGSKKTV